MAGLSRRAALLGSGAVLGVLGQRYLGARLPDLAGTGPVPGPAVPPTLNDASGLSKTPIAKHVTLTEDPGEALIAALRAELAEAAAENRPVNIGAARHSMGGQAIPRNGTAITLDSRFLQADPDKGLYRVQAGVRWREVITALDPLNLSPKVMQSNNDFGVAATFCVNAHGWPVSHGPMGSTVRRIRLMLADGSLITCSRDENPEIFAATMGGYGLTGLITELTVEAAANRRLVPTFEPMPGDAFAERFVDALADGAVDMAFGRLNVDRTRFFEDALMITYRPDPDQTGLTPAGGSGLVSRASRYLFRAQLGNERVKSLRWGVETRIGTRLTGPVTRNSLINEPVITLDDRDPARTDILHEYFVSPGEFPAFLDACREVIPRSYQELLNITLRYVAADTESVLSFAPVPRIAAVMLFSQEMTQRAEADMKRMTQDLIDRVIDIGGTYYLPYRLHARPDQFNWAYPRASEFAARKRLIDPDLRFRNAFWDTYLEGM